MWDIKKIHIKSLAEWKKEAFHFFYCVTNSMSAHVRICDDNWAKDKPKFMCDEKIYICVTRWSPQLKGESLVSFPLLSVPVCFPFSLMGFEPLPPGMSWSGSLMCSWCLTQDRLSTEAGGFITQLGYFLSRRFGRREGVARLLSCVPSNLGPLMIT